MSKKKAFKETFKPASDEEIEKRQNEEFPVNAAVFQGFMTGCKINMRSFGNFDPPGYHGAHEAQFRSVPDEIHITFQIHPDLNYMNISALQLLHSIHEECLLVIKTQGKPKKNEVRATGPSQ